jgi:hypothetical protein
VRAASPISIVISDAHAVVRQGLRLLLEAEDDIVTGGRPRTPGRQNLTDRRCVRIRPA